VLNYIARRLGQAALTIFGVMLLTFLLFRVGAGDIAAARLGEKATESQKAAWSHARGYDRPLVVNLHRQLILTDKTHGKKSLSVRDVPPSSAADSLALVLAGENDRQWPGPGQATVMLGRYVPWLDRDTPMADLTAGKPLVKPQVDEDEPQAPAPPPAATAAKPESQAASAPAGGPPAQPQTQPASAPAAAPSTTTPPSAGKDSPAAPAVMVRLSNGDSFRVDLAGVSTAGGLIDRINSAHGNDGRLHAAITDYRPGDFFQSQFFYHLWNSATFQGRDVVTNQKLSSIMGERGIYSLALMVPSLAIEFVIGMVIACFVAYYRGSIWDKLGVFLSVLGMCIPFLAFMIYGQALVYSFAPEYAYGTLHRANLYVPIAIIVISGLGGMVRFYRTVILDETGRDYVRTALAKGVPLPGVLFKHVLKNCMLPMLTSLVASIPFLIMGNLLAESFFGIPGLGDLMLSAIGSRNEPILNGLVFLSAVVYTLSVLITDISYAIFDPRIRLR
jgi:peptide/nickel transport system permease protein